MVNQENPLISVVICAFSSKRFDMTIDCINSILGNTHKNYEIILVIDGNDELKQKMESKFKEINNMTIIGNDKNRGPSVARNIGVEYAKGDIIAFIDDDALASPCWLERIIKNFSDYPKILAVGGKLLLIYENGANELPEEILWIVGGTYKGHPEDAQIVRNVFTGNMAVKKSVFKDVNFEIMYDKKETFLTFQLSHQLEDTLFCARINNIMPNKILYDPEIIVYHHVPRERLRLMYIVKEAFFEGILKARLQHIIGKDTLSHEHNYLNFILASMIKDFCTLKIRNGILLLLTMLSVSIGYTCYLLKERCFDMRN